MQGFKAASFPRTLRRNASIAMPPCGYLVRAASTADARLPERAKAGMRPPAQREAPAVRNPRLVILDRIDLVEPA